MFEAIRANLNAVRRFDHVIRSKSLEYGEVETPSGAKALAVQVDGKVMTFEENGVSQLVRQWAIPPDHFQRLPRDLQVAELSHFGMRDDKMLTLRTVENGDGNKIRATLSGRYSPFDSHDYLEAVEPVLSGWEISRDTYNRDELTLIVTKPQEFDVSTRKVGDIVKIGLTLRNNELGQGSASVDFSLWRLMCLNGAQMATSEVSVRQRHMYFNRQTFAGVMRNAVQNAASIGMGMVESLRASHTLALPNLDPDEGKLQKAVLKVLRENQAWGKEVQSYVKDQLGTKEEASLFGLVQIITGPWAKSASNLTTRNDRERVGGALLELARAA